jgi:hypothetical protein
MRRNKKNNQVNEMSKEYDFSKGIRGRHYKAYRHGHTVKIRKKDGTLKIQFFSQADGAVMLDPDVRKHFPNSHAVNKALRALIA